MGSVTIAKFLILVLVFGFSMNELTRSRRSRRGLHTGRKFTINR
jgi:hypothetical protein